MNIRLMRGQVVVREVFEKSEAGLWTPEPTARSQKTHTGEVLAMGAPACTPSGAEVEPGFRVGDTVQFHFGAMGTQESRTRTWIDGKPATWMTQAEIDGVWES